MIRPNMISSVAVLTLVIASSFCGQVQQTNVPSANKSSQETEAAHPSLQRAIQVVQKESGVYLYRYAETIESIDPRSDYTEKYRIFRQSTVEDLRNLIASNRDYKPEFKARCLPVWDAGLEFRNEGESVMFLFSFRCNTIRYLEGNLFKDFTPQRTAFYKIFQYEINEDSAVLLQKR